MINKMPNVALGTWMINDPKAIEQVIPAALNNGYKHIDTAQVYFNEEFIGEALAKLNKPREEYWITSKVWTNNFKYHTYLSVEKSLEKLQTKYIDTMLLHAMVDKETNIIAYKELMRARENGLVRTIGVSNFSIEALKEIKEATGEYPAYNQIINSVKQRMVELETFCKENGIELMGYSSIRPYYNPNQYFPNSGLTSEEKEVVDQIAAKHNSTPAMVLSRWSLNHGYIILPKSQNPDRVISNFDVTKLELSNEDMKVLDSMNSFGDEDFMKTMEIWKEQRALSEESFKMGVRISKESDTFFLGTNK